MEIPAWMFFSFCAIIGVTFLKLGFNALDKTDLSDSVSPMVMSLFKHSLAISICHSSNYALIFRPLWHIPVYKYCSFVMMAFIVLLFYRTAGESFAWNSLIYYLIHFFVLLCHPILNDFFNKYYLFVMIAFLIPLFYGTGSESFEWYFAICAWINLSVVVPEPNLVSVFEDKIGLGIYFTVESSLFLVGGKTKLYPILVLFVAFFTSASWAVISWNESLLSTIVEKRLFSILRKNKKVKFIEFGVGMVGTILFQNFFRLTSLDHVLAFLYLTVAWLANLALLRASFDFGVFNFLLSNVIVGCTLNQFGLQGATWLAYGASLLLYGLRLKLEYVFLINRGGAHVIRL